MAYKSKSKDDKLNNQPLSDEEQILRRQSARKPSAIDELTKMQEQQMMSGQGLSSGGAIDGFRALENPIGKDAVAEATQILKTYKEGKINLERKIIDNEQWYKLRHWECMRGNDSEVEPTSAWLFNCVVNKHADAMDNFPSPNILPREEDDKAEAEMLTSILPVVLDMNDFEQTYSDVCDYKIKTGAGVYGVFWDSSKLNGLGDISIKKVDIINLFWESGIKDIQKSRNIFHVELCDNDVLISRYPQLQGKLGSNTLELSKYVYDDSVDTSKKSAVIDWYYKKTNSSGKQVLHYCKYVNTEVLFATENSPEFAERGFYDHGEYPFIFDVLFAVEGTPAGFGYIDVGKSAQEYIDRGNQAIMMNMLANTKPRHFIRDDGSVREEEYADLTKDFVHVDGNLGQDSILPIQGKPLSPIYLSVLHDKIDELKETTGNRDISTGGTANGVTAASAIAAMQEASSKLSRDSNKASYRAFKKICLMCIELIRQFYDLPRCFRIIGSSGEQKFVYYSNQGIVPQSQGNDFGMDMGMRIPLFDIEVTAQKQSPYSKMSQNELALQFYNAGFFNPNNSDQALACLDMMDFDRKQFVVQKINQNNTMFNQMIMLAQMVDQLTGSGGYMANNLAQQYGMSVPGQMAVQMPSSDDFGGDLKAEASNTKQARQRVADSTAPL